MSAIYLQEKIIGNPGQIVTINSNNQISLTAYKPTLNKVIKVNGPSDATIYASYLSSSSDLVPLSIKGILKYDHTFDCVATNNVTASMVNLDTWMATSYAANYQTVFTYKSGNWKNSSNQTVNLINLGINFSASPSGSSPVTGSTITVTANYNKARYEIYPPNTGTWTVACTTLAGYADTEVIVGTASTYTIDLSIFQAYVQVNYTMGATCTLYNEENNYTMVAPNTDGSYIFKVPYQGLWKITVELVATSASTGQSFTKTRYDMVNVTTLNQQISRTVKVISSVLNDCTWDEIQYIADNNLGPDYWSIGDCKEIVLNGPWTHTRYFSQEVYQAFIIGFNHNSTVEGRGITFEIGKVDSASNDICLFERMGIASGYPESGYLGEANIAYASNIWMCDNNTDPIGWSTSNMRTYVLGSVNNQPYDQTTNPTGYKPGTIMSLLPDDLRIVMKKVTKWTDNTGGTTQSSSNVTATNDYLFLLSGYEVFGTTTGFNGRTCNASEANKQMQYQYYINANNTRLKYYNSTDSNSPYGITYKKQDVWLRSPVNYIGSSQNFAVAASRSLNNLTKSSAYGGNPRTPYVQSLGICPCFVVGSEESV